MEKPEPQTRPIEQPTELLLEQPKERPAQQPRSKKSNLNMKEPTVCAKKPSHLGKMLKEPTLNRHDRETQYRKEIIFVTPKELSQSEIVRRSNLEWN